MIRRIHYPDRKVASNIPLDKKVLIIVSLDKDEYSQAFLPPFLTLDKGGQKVQVGLYTKVILGKEYSENDRLILTQTE